MLRILHLWKSDSPSGGAGGAASMYRLHSSLKRAGVQSRILCTVKVTDSPDVLALPRPPRAESLLRPICSRLGLNDIHRISSFKLPRHPAYAEADVVNFHGTHGGFISYLALPALTAEKACVFTLHDMWCLTGHCGYSYDCERWKTGCGHCPYPKVNPSIHRDATRIEWKLKRWVYQRSRLTFVAVSHWLAKLARQSIVGHFPIHVIPNGVDTEAYRPLDREWCRALLGIERAKKVIMFSAVKLNDIRKGGDLLMKALQHLPRSLQGECLLLLLGGKGEEMGRTTGMQALSLGFVSNDRLKAIAYSAADVFVLPTRTENLPNVLIESMACGTPVVSFRVGGVPEVAREGVTGYLAQPEDAQELARGIAYLLEDTALREQMGRRCWEIAASEYSAELEAQRYLQLYREVQERLDAKTAPLSPAPG